MPIQSVVQRNLNAVANLSMIGIIHKGGERTETMIANKQPGPDLDYFRIQTLTRFTHLDGDIKRIYGDKPKFLDPVLVLGVSADKAFEFWREERGLGGKRIIRRCDEEHQIMWPVNSNPDHYDPKNDDLNNIVQANYARDPIACRGGGEQGGCAVCKYKGRLHVILFELFRQSGAMGYFLVETGSQIDIASISGSLSRLTTYANLERIPFRLGREERHVGWRSYKDKQTGATKTAEIRKNLIYLDLSTQISAVPVLAPGFEQMIGLPAQVGAVPVVDQPALPSGAAPLSPPVVPSDVMDGEFTETDEEPQAPPFAPTNTPPAPAKQPDPPPLPPADHWCLSASNREIVMKTFALYGIPSDGVAAALPEVEAGITRLGESKAPTVKAFCDLIHKRYSKPADQGRWVWSPNQTEAFEKEVTDSYPGVLVADMLDAIGAKAWTLPPAEERKLIAAAALKEGWAVTAKEVKYHQGKTKAESFFEFPTVIGGIRWFEGTNKFIEIAGAGYSRANDVEHWRNLTAPRPIEPIVLNWVEKIRADQTTYLVVTGVRMTSNLDRVLEGDPKPEPKPEPKQEPEPEGEVP